MNKVIQSVGQIFKGALTAFRRFPASIGCAVGFSVVTMVRIQMDWQQQEPYNFLFNCLHWALALGAIVSLAAVVFAVSRSNGRKAFLLANGLGVLSAVGAFLLLFFFARLSSPDYRVDMISNLAQVRISALIFVSLVFFILFTGGRDARTDFDRALFMTQKAFFIALIYWFVIFTGASGVASAVQFLIYRGMSSKVYMYIGTLSGLTGYTLFVGYFPDFTKGIVDEKREEAQKQPRFISVLFSNIMVPIALALTLVLLIWTVRTVLTGMHVRFIQLYSIASAYTIGGLWLHAMTIRNQANLARIYRTVYPIASLIILAVEAWAVISQLVGSGLKTTEYVFILLWILALSGSILILVKKIKAYTVIALIACGLSVLAVMPVIGYQILPVHAQVNRLENLLVEEGMLMGDTLSPAQAEPEESVRIAITDAVDFLLYVQEVELPSWLDTDAIKQQSFEATFGFERIWPKVDEYEINRFDDYIGIYLTLGSEAMPIGDYDWVVIFENYMAEQTYAGFTGSGGVYKVDWVTETENQPPRIRITLNDEVVVEQSLDEYFDKLGDQYDRGGYENVIGSLEDMSIWFETDGFEALLILEYVDYSIDVRQDSVHYWAEPGALFFREK